MSKSFPGSMPSVFSFSTIGASAGAGGLSFISRASRPKKAPASIFCTCSVGGVFVSTPGGDRHLGRRACRAGPRR